MDVEKLDDGQRQAIKTLPGLEAVQKELGEVKKVIEVLYPVHLTVFLVHLTQFRNAS
jgi:hypothetical protein